MYWASGAIHGPHHIMKEWADKYKGKFDDGWDAYRERVFKRAKDCGWIPADTELTPRADTLASWDSIPEDEKPFQRRLMEVCAGFTEHVDHQVGRLLDEVDNLGYGDNTLVFYIWGDNGSSGEGQNRHDQRTAGAERHSRPRSSDHIAALDALGGLDVLGLAQDRQQYHAGWAWAGSTPYKGMKLLASHLGGTRNPMAVRWPAKIKPDATPRTQFHHVNDIVPDDLRGRRHHATAGGERHSAGPDRRRQPGLFVQRPATPRAGCTPSISRSWAAARSTTTAGWLRPSVRANRGRRDCPPGIRDWTPDDDVWELYNLDADWSQAKDLASEMPEKLAQMKELFAMEAARNKVYPVGGGLWVPVLHPELRISPPYTEWDFAAACSGCRSSRRRR